MDAFCRYDRITYAAHNSLMEFPFFFKFNTQFDKKLKLQRLTRTFSEDNRVFK